MRSIRVGSLSLMWLLTACSGEGPEAAGRSKGLAPELAGIELAERPAGAVMVLEAKKNGTAEQAIVSGRISSVVPGFAVFTLMDLSLPYCGEKNKENGCPTPWDYCCESGATRKSHSLVVEVRGATGNPLPVELSPGLRHLDAVTVRGSLTKDAHGNLVLIATGWHRDARPVLPERVRLPQ